MGWIHVLTVSAAIVGPPITPTAKVESKGQTLELALRFPVSTPGGTLEHAGSPSELEFQVAADDQIARVPSVDAFLLPYIETASYRFFPTVYLVLHHEAKPDRNIAHVLPTKMRRLDNGTYRLETAALQPDEIRRTCQRLRTRERPGDPPRFYAGVVLYSGPGNRHFYPVELVLED